MKHKIYTWVRKHFSDEGLAFIAIVGLLTMAALSIVAAIVAVAGKGR